MRARSTPSSNSLMLPFMPSSKPIVRPAGIIDAVEIDHAGLDQAAELEQMMPVATVPGETGSVEAQHGSHFAGAKPRDEPLEPGPGHRPAGGTAKVVVDHLDVAEAPAPSVIDELVLAPLALEIGLNLGLGGLADINDRLALQHRRGKEISVVIVALLRRHAGRLQQQSGQPGERRPALRRAASPGAFRNRAGAERGGSAVGGVGRLVLASHHVSSLAMVESPREFRRKPRSIEQS